MYVLHQSTTRTDRSAFLTYIGPENDLYVRMLMFYIDITDIFFNNLRIDEL